MEEQTTALQGNALQRIVNKPPRWKLLVNWVFIGAAAMYSAFHAGFVIWNTTHRTQELLAMVYAHYACIVVVPFAGYAALGLVFLLESSSQEPIEFKALGFDFKGPAAPIVLWVLCFLAIVVAIGITWPLKA